MFIQFAEDYFTDYTADSLHNPTVKSCLLRVPGSLNSKYVINKGEVTVDPEVRIYKNGMVKDHPYYLSYEILEDGLSKRELMRL